MSAKALSFLWLLLPLIGWIIRQRVPLFRNHRVWFFLGIVLIGSLLIVTTSRLRSAELKQKMEQYEDLDGNGVLSSWEMTPEAKAAMDDYASDTGRSFAPFTAGPMTAIWTGFWFSLFSAAGWLCRKLFHRKAPA